MSKTIIRGIVFPIGSNEPKEVMVEQDNIEDIYKYIESPIMDVVSICIDEHQVSVYVDDEGLLKTDNLGRDVKGYPNPLFGSLLFLGGVDNYGRTLGLDDEITIETIKDIVSEPRYRVG